MKAPHKILLLFLALLSASLFAQENEKENFNRWSLGLKFLPGYSTFYNYSEEIMGEFSPYISYNLGASANLNLNNFFSISTGLIWFDKGATRTVTFNYPETYSTVSTHHHYYLVLPILFQINMNRFYFALGPEINYYIRRKLIYEGEQLGGNKKLGSKKSLLLGGGQYWVVI